MGKFDMKKQKEIGFRFLLFRKAIQRTEEQLAGELGTQKEEITKIEAGEIAPRIVYLNYLHNTYHLDINWLLTKYGSMFIIGSEPGNRMEKQTEKYGELLSLMQVPVIGTAMSRALSEIKALLELERKAEEEAGKKTEKKQ